MEEKGAPTLGDDIWIGINASIVGGVKVGNDVMIAPGAFVNRDVPKSLGSYWQSLHYQA